MPARQKPAERTPSRRQIARQRRETVRADAAARERACRKLCTLLLFWKFCGDRQCLRARACAVNADDCFARFWPLVPEELKISIRTTIKAGKAGLSPAETAAEIECELVRWRETTAPPAPEKLEPQFSVEQPVPQVADMSQSRPACPPPIPRVRML